MNKYQEFISFLQLERERLNWKLVLTFVISLATLLPAISTFLKNLSTLDLTPYLAQLSMDGALDLSFEPAINWLNSYVTANFFLTILGIFILFAAYHLYVTVYVAKFIGWIAKKSKSNLSYYQVYNSLLLVYAVKTLIDVFVIGIFFNWLFVGIENAVEYSIWVENIGLYLWLYFILKNIRRVESPKSKVKSPAVTGL